MTDLKIIAKLKVNGINLIEANNDNIKILLKQKKKSYYIIENNIVYCLCIYKNKVDNFIFTLITELSQLKTLELEYTRIPKIPESLLLLKNLKELNLSNNNIIEIPENISKLKNIWLLNFSNNKIQRIPKSLLLLENLLDFKLDNNPLTKEPLYLKIKNSLSSIFEPFDLNFDMKNELTSVTKKIINFNIFDDVEQQINFLIHIQEKSIDWWEVNTIRAIMHSDTLNKDGILDEKKFAEIFKKNTEVINNYKRIINYLIQFNLAFKLDENKILIPSKVPQNFAKVNMQYIAQYFNFMYKYSNGVKNSFFYKFIIEMEDLIDNSLEKPISRKVVLLKYKDSKAIVSFGNIKNSIIISIDTLNKEGMEFLSNIRRIFDKINHNIDVSEHILELDSQGIILNLKDTKELDENYEITYTIPLIITEGKTDWKHLKKALERFKDRGEYLDLIIKFDEYENRGSGEKTLDQQIKSLAKHQQIKKHICIFDRDTSSYVKEYGNKEFMYIIDKDYTNRLKEKIEKYYSDKSAPKYQDIVKKLDNGSYRELDEIFQEILTGNDYKEWQKLSNSNVYAFCIPEIKDSDSPRTLDKICIEFYYKEKDLKTTDSNEKRLFFADEFEFNKEHNGDSSKRFISKCGKFKTESCQVKNGARAELTLISSPVYAIDDEKCQKNLLLSKNDFTNHILNDVKGFDNFDIENFRLIFDVIERIVNA